LIKQAHGPFDEAVFRLRLDRSAQVKRAHWLNRFLAECVGNREQRYRRKVAVLILCVGDRVAMTAEDFGQSARSTTCPKKSLAVTLPPVASTIFAIRRLSGMRSPLTYRRTASELTPIRFANWR
jgi:hypothetical protein